MGKAIPILSSLYFYGILRGDIYLYLQFLYCGPVLNLVCFRTERKQVYTISILSVCPFSKLEHVNIFTKLGMHILTMDNTPKS